MLNVLFVLIILLFRLSFTVMFMLYVASASVGTPFVKFIETDSIRSFANVVLAYVVLFSSPVLLCSSNVTYPPPVCPLLLFVSLVVMFISIAVTLA